MSRHMTVTLLIEVRDFTPEELAENGIEWDEGDEPGDSDIAELRASEIAELIPSTLKFEETQDEMFAGSCIFARLEDVQLVSAEWKDSPPHDR